MNSFLTPPPKLTPILVADDDPIVREVLNSSLGALGFSPRCVEDGDQAIAVLDGPDPPRIAIVDWMMPNRSGLEVVRYARQSGYPFTYFLLLTARGGADLERAFEAGVNDVMIKPVLLRELETRLAVAMSALERGRGDILGQTLREALSDGEGSGEIIVSGGRTTGRIHVDDHEIVWVRVLPEPVGIAQLLQSDLGLRSEEVRAVIEECHRTRRTFDTVVVEWELATLDRLRECMRHYFFTELSTLRALRPARAAFFPGSAKTDSAIRFSLEEVAPWAVVPPSILPPSDFPPPISGHISGRLMEDRVAMLRNLSGIKAVFVLDIQSGTVMTAYGDRRLVESAWVLTRGLEHVDRVAETATEEMISSTKTHHFLVQRVVPEHGEQLAIAIVVGRPEGNLAYSRLELARACELM